MPRRNSEALEAENAQQRALIASLRAQIAEQQAQIGDLSQQLARLIDQSAELLAIACRKKGAVPAPKLKPPRPPPDVSPDDAAAFADRPLPPVLAKRGKPPPKPRRPTGRKPLPPDLPADQTILSPEVCSCGCADLEIVDEVVEEKLHVVREHQRRRVVVRKTGRCRHCLKRTTPDSLPAPFERSKVTCDWLAWFIVQKFYLLVPLDRIRRHLALSGVPLAISFLVSQVERASDLLGATDGEHWKQLKAGSWMATDGTGLKVIVPKVPGTHNGYLEVFRRDELVVFQYEPSKDGETIKAKLKEFEGCLVVDAESRFNAVFQDNRRLEAGCNAHGRRKFEAAEAVQPALAAEGGAYLSAVFAAEAEARAQGLEGDALRAWRQARIGPLFDQMRRWMDAVAPTLLPDDPVARAIRYYENHWAALTRCVDHPQIPLDNSGAEREFQTVAKARLSWLFAGSTEGAHRAATLLGVIATCRNLGVDPQAYLTWVFERRGTAKARYGRSAAELTPAVYKATGARPGPPPSG